jgi:flagellar operon protein
LITKRIDPQPITNTSTQGNRLRNDAPSLNGNEFAQILNGGLQKPQMNSAPSMDPVKFSNHAVDRMVSRGIHFNSADVGKITEAVGRADAKGSKSSLILYKDNALIVSVKNKMVVTVMDKTALKENVFTNIDSTIVI